ncbi:NAD(P)/FAD-dependent oxidoreductase, partial [uncultured Mitsuokella sp.]
MTKECKTKDVIIIGAGMAGLTAALYAGRSNLSTLVLENAIVGGQIANAVGIENYPGFTKVSGSDLMTTVQQQAEAAGAEVDEFDMIERVDLTGKTKIVETQSCIYEAKVVIITSGMERRKLPLREEAKYSGRGVHYCELCDGHMYQDKVISVMGGGNAAVDAANFLTKYAKELYLIHRSKLRADKASQDKLFANPKVKVLLETEIRALHGEGRLTSITIYDKAKDEERELPVDAIFVNIGVVPNTHL